MTYCARVPCAYAKKPATSALQIWQNDLDHPLDAFQMITVIQLYKDNKIENLYDKPRQFMCHFFSDQDQRHVSATLISFFVSKYFVTLSMK